MDARLTKEIISRARVIAQGRRIRDIGRLIATYGGTPARWSKKSSPVLEHEGRRFEFHWYEHHGLGRFEVKRVDLD